MAERDTIMRGQAFLGIISYAIGSLILVALYLALGFQGEDISEPDRLADSLYLATFLTMALAFFYSGYLLRNRTTDVGNISSPREFVASVGLTVLAILLSLILWLAYYELSLQNARICGFFWAWLIVNAFLVYMGIKRLKDSERPGIGPGSVD